MPSFNQVILLGNITRDPQLKFLPSQMPVVEFGLAMNRKFRTAAGEDREEVTFVDCSAFSKQAELINQYFTKGKPIFIQGRLKLDSWEDKQGGGKRSKLSVVVENFQFVGGRDGAQSGQGGDYSADTGDQRPASERRPRSNGSGRYSEPPPYSDEQQFKNDDIPF